MSTLRTTCVFVTALILALWSSASHAATTAAPTQTPTPTPTPTSTACAGEPPQVNPVTSPTNLLQQTITGFGRPLTDVGGSHSIIVTTPAGAFSAHTSSPDDFPFSTFAATVNLVLGVNDLTVCHTSICGFRPCTSYDLNGNPLRIIVNAPAPTDTPTPTPTVPGTFVPCSTFEPCVGDCDSSSQVEVSDIILMANITLGNLPVSSCTPGDTNGDREITVDEIVAAVNSLLCGCVP